MNTTVLVVGFLVAFVTALCLTPLVALFAKYNKWIDLPGGERTVHNRPIPRAGGIAVIITFVLGIGGLMLASGIIKLPLDVITSLSPWTLLLGGGTIALTGLYDDAYGLGFKKKFLFQLIVAYAMYLAGYRVDMPAIYFLESDPYLQAALGLPLTMLWYLGVMNAMNLIDGLDGLAAGVSIIVFCCLATIFGLNGDLALIPVAIIMAGALLGFLIYNFNPALIFLGDTGSLFLGFMIATYALQGTLHTNPLVSLVVMSLVVGYPLLDTTLALVRRFLKGRSPFAPDKDHIHHRMSRRLGITTRKAVILLYLIHGLLCIAAIALVLVEVSYMIMILTLVVGGLILLLKRLGYLNMQRGLILIRRRLSDQLGERVPRGQWGGDGSVLEPVPPQKTNLRAEKEEEREFVIHSVD